MGASSFGREKVSGLQRFSSHGARDLRGRRAAKKTKALIAIGISVQINRKSSMQWRIEQAAKAGASYDEVPGSGGSGDRNGWRPRHGFRAFRVAGDGSDFYSSPLMSSYDQAVLAISTILFCLYRKNSGSLSFDGPPTNSEAQLLAMGLLI